MASALLRRAARRAPWRPLRIAYGGVRTWGGALWVDIVASFTPAYSTLPPQLSTAFPAHGLTDTGLRQTTLPPGQAHRVEVTVGGHKIVFESEKLARLADGAAVVKMGDTHVLATACSARTADEGSDFLPLSVEYREKLMAVGRIPQTFNRREGAPKDREILVARAVDRPLRPLFPEGYFYETQIIHHLLSVDNTQETDHTCINAASAALVVSDIPWHGPVGAVRVAVIGGEMVLFPTVDQLEEASFNLLYACTAERALMVEAGGVNGGVPDSVFAEALQFAHVHAVQLIAPQIELAKKVARPKRVVQTAVPCPALLQDVRETLTPLTQHIISQRLAKTQREASFGEARRRAGAAVKEAWAARGETVGPAALLVALDTVEGEVVRRQILSGSRCDGRALDELRPIHGEVALLPPVVHGSSLFCRGDTQALATVTVGSLDDKQRLDGVVGPEHKRLMLHYGFPPFSVNECGKVGGASRREIGHGALAEKALAGVMPDASTFPFVVRVSSDTLGSNGSSSMAAVCAGSLALMDAGVPVLGHVAGISCGLILDETDSGQVTGWTVFTDIMGLEDHHGDMDFKIAGTRHGITAVQLDIKPAGVPLACLLEALKPSKVAREKLLDVAEAVMATPNTEMKASAPRFATIAVPRDMLGKVIGPQGSNIKSIERDTSCRVSILQDTGEVSIFAPSSEALAEASRRIQETMDGEVKVGSRYQGKVLSIKEFGAIVELSDHPSGAMGLLHISELEHGRTQRVEDVVSVAERLEVMVVGKDQRGNIKLSLKALLPTPRPSSNASRR